MTKCSANEQKEEERKPFRFVVEKLNAIEFNIGRSNSADESD